MQERTQGLLRTGTLIMLLCLTCFCGQANAQDSNRSVEARDLDLSRLADAEELYSRIRSAAHSACQANKALWDVKRVLHARLCTERVVEETIARADQPLLTTVHQASRERLAQR